MAAATHVAINVFLAMAAFYQTFMLDATAAIELITAARRSGRLFVDADVVDVHLDGKGVEVDVTDPFPA